MIPAAVQRVLKKLPALQLGAVLFPPPLRETAHLLSSPQPSCPPQPKSSGSCDGIPLHQVTSPLPSFFCLYAPVHHLQRCPASLNITNPQDRGM